MCVPTGELTLRYSSCTYFEVYSMGLALCLFANLMKNTTEDSANDVSDVVNGTLSTKQLDVVWMAP